MFFKLSNKFHTLAASFGRYAKNNKVMLLSLVLVFTFLFFYFLPPKHLVTSLDRLVIFVWLAEVAAVMLFWILGLRHRLTSSD